MRNDESAFGAVFFGFLLAEREGLLHKHTAYFDLDDFGKTVFLTREEAEKELEERGKS